MTHSDPRPRLRVALAVVPPLLADSLRRLLEDTAEVTVVLEDTDEVFDVAVTCPGAPPVQAALVIELDVDPDACGGGWAHTPHGGKRLANLDAVLAYLRSAST